MPASRPIARPGFARPTFGQFLLGTVSLDRPSFFYAYAALWLHLLAGSLLALVLIDRPLTEILVPVGASSVALALVVYALLGRTLWLLVNLGPYAATMGRLVYAAPWHSVVVVASMVILVVSVYSLLAREYRRYAAAVHAERPERGVPPWIAVATAGLVLLLCLFGLTLL